MIIKPNWSAPPQVHAVMMKLPCEYPLPSEPIWLKQVHGTGVVQLPGPINQEADASLTTTPGVVCVVKTADCLPILVTNQLGQEVAAIHAGWRGLVAGVIEATFAKMVSHPEHCLAWIGPSISQAHFEVGPEVRGAFLERHPDFSPAFIKNQRDHYQANLAWMAEQILQKIGVQKIDQSGLCTYADSRFYSYRRNPGEVRRLASLIYLDAGLCS
jgi:YfiH family protein